MYKAFVFGCILVCGSVNAETVFDSILTDFHAASDTSKASFTTEAVWTGICVNPSDPNTSLGGGIAVLTVHTPKGIHKFSELRFGYRLVNSEELRVRYWTDLDKRSKADLAAYHARVRPWKSMTTAPTEYSSPGQKNFLHWSAVAPDGAVNYNFYLRRGKTAAGVDQVTSMQRDWTGAVISGCRYDKELIVQK